MANRCRNRPFLLVRGWSTLEACFRSRSFHIDRPGHSLYHLVVSSVDSRERNEIVGTKLRLVRLSLIEQSVKISFLPL